MYEPSIGLEGALVIDNVAAGPAIGGLRMAPDVTLEECARLARAMTMKNAAAGLAHGGGKSVLRGDPGMPAGRKETLIRAMACALGDCRDYIFGPDMGTEPSSDHGPDLKTQPGPEMGDDLQVQEPQEPGDDGGTGGDGTQGQT